VCRDRLGTAENRIRGLKRCFPKEPRPQYLWEQVKRAPGVTQDGMSPIARLFFVLVSMRSKHDLEREAKRHNSQTPLLHRWRPGVYGSAGHEQHDLCSATPLWVCG